MAAQSFAMGHAFGTSFQYGKRKISSMTNEEFNALSATDLHGELQADIRAMIPNMNQSFKTMEQFQIDIINSMVNTLKIAAAQFFEWITTGRVTTPNTSTSAFDYGEGGIATATEIQGGDRYDPAGSYIPQGSDLSYEEWLKQAAQGQAAAGSNIPEKKYITTKKIYTKYDPLRKSKTAFASKELKAQEKKVEQTRILKNIGNLDVRIHNISVLISNTISGLDTRDKRIRIKMLKKLKIQRNIQKDLKKKRSNALIQYKNTQR